MVPINDFLDEIIVYEGGYLHTARVYESRIISGKSGSSLINVVDTMPWTYFAEIFLNGASSSVKIGNVRYIAPKDAGGIYSFTDAGTGLIMKILNMAMTRDGVDVRQLYEIGTNCFYAATSAGVYRYMHIDGVPAVNRISPSAGYDVRQVISYNFGGTDAYLMVNSDNFMYESENARVWKKTFKPLKSGQLFSVYPKNAHEWYFGGSSGLYRSEYRYREVDDVMKFTEKNMYELYQRLISSDISTMYDDAISAHELSPSYMDGHAGSLIDGINKDLMDVNFDRLSSGGWQSSDGSYSAGEFLVRNDIVMDQQWGDDRGWSI